MPKTNQAQKHATGLAGEFLVAGELLRRGIMAAVTYGNAKKADVVAIGGGRSATIEVKTTAASKWVLGSDLPPEDAQLWVLVHLPSDLSAPPEYFVLTGKELRLAVLPRHDAYNRAYLAKHGVPYSKTGVVSVLRSEIDGQHRGAWEKVATAVTSQAAQEPPNKARQATPPRRTRVVSRRARAPTSAGKVRRSS
jgi:hypothetical protein